MITRRGRSRLLAAGVAVLAPLAACAFSGVPSAGAQEPLSMMKLPPPGALLTDAPVDAITGGGGRAFFQGGFAHAGYYSGPSVLLDPASGAADPSSARLDGLVSDAVPDGAGGFFAGGAFTQAADVPHANVVHVKADGTVDNVFAAATDGAVNAVALAGGRLYLGGDFAMVGGQPHVRIAVVDAATGAALPFAASSSQRVTELALDGDRLYVGGLNGPLQSLDAGTGASRPGFAAAPQAVRALAVSGGRLYVGGPAGITALDATTGNVDPSFQPTLGTAGGEVAVVHALLLDGPRLLVGGDFGDRNALLAVDAVSGAPDPAFAPRLTPTPQPTGFITGPGRPDTEGDTGVFDIVRTGDAYWVGGRFGRAGGPEGANLAVLDAATGAARAVKTPYVDGQVNALAIAPPGGRLFAGGNFRMAGGRAVSSLMKADPATLALDPVFGSAAPHDLGPGYYRDFFATPTRLFKQQTGGQNYGSEVPRFTATTAVVRSADLRTGDIRRWTGTVRNLAGFVPYGRNDVLLARRLENRPGFPRNVIERRAATTGRIKQRFRVPLRGYIQSLTVTRDGSLYVAGSFRRKRPNGQQANLALLRMNPRTGRMYNGFDPHAHGPISGVTELADGALQIGGDFTKIQGVRARYNATIERLGGFLLRHRLDTYASPSVVAGRRLIVRSVYGVPTGGEDQGQLFYVVSVPAAR